MEAPGADDAGGLETSTGSARPDPDRVHPTLDDPVARALSEGIGGPIGSHAGRHRWWTPLRVVLALTALCFALGMVQKAPCYENTWSDNKGRYAQMCYSDLPYLYIDRGMVERAWPYTDDPATRARFDVMEYPVGISYWAYGTAWVTHALVGVPVLAERSVRPLDELWGRTDVQREVRGFVIVNALGFAALALLAAGLLTRVNPHRPWDALPFALSPALAFTGLINWDLVAVACVAAALWAWARGGPAGAWWTGVFLGLGTAAKLYPLFGLGALVVICLRERRPADLARAVFAAVITWVVVNAPGFVTGPDAWRVFWSFNSDRGADLGSLWLVWSQVRGPVEVGLINDVSLAFFAGWCLVVLTLGLAAPTSPRFTQLFFLLVAGFLLVNKVYSPQYVLWLLPLAVLARPRWRDLLIWQATEVFYWMAVWWYLGEYITGADGAQSPLYWVAIALRVLGELYLVAMVSVDILRPGRDPVVRVPLAQLPVRDAAALS